MAVMAIGKYTEGDQLTTVAVAVAAAPIAVAVRVGPVGVRLLVVDFVGYFIVSVQAASSHAFVVLRHEDGLGPLQQGRNPSCSRRLHRRRFIFCLVPHQHSLKVSGARPRRPMPTPGS